MAYSQRNLKRQDLENIRLSGWSARARRGNLTERFPSPSTAALAWGDLFFILGCVLLGAILRLDFLLAGGFIVDADEAIVGLMAKHIAEGAPLPTFYYGQHYMGSFEPYLVSLLYRVFGVSAGALKTVPLLFSLALIPLAYALGKELGGRFAGRCAALLMAIPPAALVVWSSMARGGFIELVFLGSYALLLCVRWLKAGLPTLAGTIAIGFILGFGWWTNNQIIFFMVPIAYAMAARLIREDGYQKLDRVRLLISHGLTGTAAFIVGGLPFWIYNLANGFVSFQMFRNAPKSELGKHLEGFYSTSIPIIFGAKHFWETHDIFPGSTTVAVFLYAIVFATFVISNATDILNLARFKINRETPAALLLVFLVCTCAIFVLSSFGHLVQAPRYLLPGYIGLFTLTALSLLRIRNFSPLISLLILVSLLGFNIASCYAGGRAVPGQPVVFIKDRVSSDHTELKSFLREKHYPWVRTNYWIGYRLAFETNEDVRFLIFGAPHQTRIESYRRDGSLAGEELMPLVLTPNQAHIVESALITMGIRYTKDFASGYPILHELAESQVNLKEVEPTLLQLTSTHKPESAEQIIDGDLKTRWGSGAPQRPGMQVSIELKNPIALRGLRLDVGKWETDYARGLKIDIETETGELRQILHPDHYWSVRFYMNENTILPLLFEPVAAKKVILTQTGSDPVFDWSIAELTLLQ